MLSGYAVVDGQRGHVDPSAAVVDGRALWAVRTRRLGMMEVEMTKMRRLRTIRKD